MPLSFTSTAGGTGFVDVRAGAYNNVHQTLLDVSAITADADGYIPPGLPIITGGGAVSGADQTAIGVVGPEAVKEGAADHFGNVILDGVLNKDAIEDNLGRVLSANELTALANGGFTLL